MRERGQLQRAFALEPTPLVRHVRGVIAEKIPQLQSLSPEDKLILVGELWEQLAADPRAFPARQNHVALLEERLEHFRQHPNDVHAWEDVKNRILASR